jgi:hypothetical protein
MQTSLVTHSLKKAERMGLLFFFSVQGSSNNFREAKMQTSLVTRSKQIELKSLG